MPQPKRVCVKPSPSEDTEYFRIPDDFDGKLFEVTPTGCLYILNHSAAYSVAGWMTVWVEE